MIHFLLYKNKWIFLFIYYVSLNHFHKDNFIPSGNKKSAFLLRWWSSGVGLECGIKWLLCLHHHRRTMISHRRADQFFSFFCLSKWLSLISLIGHRKRVGVSKLPDGADNRSESIMAFTSFFALWSRWFCPAASLSWWKCECAMNTIPDGSAMFQGPKESLEDTQAPTWARVGFKKGPVTNFPSSGMQPKTMAGPWYEGKHPSPSNSAEVRFLFISYLFEVHVRRLNVLVAYISKPWRCHLDSEIEVVHIKLCAGWEWPKGIPIPYHCCLWV